MNNKTIKIKKANIKDINEIHNMLSEINNEINDKNLFFYAGLNYVKEQLLSGLVIKAINKNNKIIGVFIIRYFGKLEDNLGVDIKLPYSELNYVVHMETVAVLKNYRGNNLQSKMLEYAENLIDKTHYKYFLTTVSPNNEPSKKSFINNNYKFIMQKEKYGGVIRNIYCKKI